MRITPLGNIELGTAVLIDTMVTDADGAVVEPTVTLTARHSDGTSAAITGGRFKAPKAGSWIVKAEATGTHDAVRYGLLNVAEPPRV